MQEQTTRSEKHSEHIEFMAENAIAIQLVAKQERPKIDRAKKVIKRNEDFVSQVQTENMDIAERAKLSFTAYQICCDRVALEQDLNIFHFFMGVIELEAEQEQEQEQEPEYKPEPEPEYQPEPEPEPEPEQNTNHLFYPLGVTD